MKEFKCLGEDNEHIPKELLDIGMKFPKAYSEKNSIVKLSKELKTYKKDSICFLPFCLTVLPEAFGSQVNLGDHRYLPRIKGYAINSLDEIDDLKDINLKEGRIKEVLEAIEELRKEGEYVALRVEGVFTVIGSIMEPRLFYKLLRKNEEKALRLIEMVEEGIVAYIREGIKRGANIISYGDSSGVESIVGKNIYLNYSGKSNYNIIKRASELADNNLIHICGLTSWSLYNNGFIQFEDIDYDKNLKYGQAILKLLKNNANIKVLGGRCIKNTNTYLKEPSILRVVFK